MKLSFYKRLHAGNYSGATYNMEALLGLPVMKDWMNQPRTRPFTMVDVGCGKGVFLRDFLRLAGERWPLGQIEAAGVDLVRNPANVFPEIPGKPLNFKEMSVDGATLPFPDHSFDLVTSNHCLEHIFETEKLVREFRRVVRPDGLCVISVPNIASWVNRIEFLLAGQPLGSELGTEKLTYGFWPRAIQKKMESWEPSGHIRDFTPRGLEDLTIHCGFQPVGWWKQGTKWIARLGKWAGREMGIVLKPAPAAK